MAKTCTICRARVLTVRVLRPAVVYENPGRVQLWAASQSAAAAAVPTSPIEEHVTVQEEGKEEEKGTEHIEHLEPRFGVRESQLWTIDVQEERRCHLDRAAACRRSS